MAAELQNVTPLLRHVWWRGIFKHLEKKPHKIYGTVKLLNLDSLQIHLITNKKTTGRVKGGGDKTKNNSFQQNLLSIVHLVPPRSVAFQQRIHYSLHGLSNRDRCWDGLLKQNIKCFHLSYLTDPSINQPVNQTLNIPINQSVRLGSI